MVAPPKPWLSRKAFQAPNTSTVCGGSRNEFGAVESEDGNTAGSRTLRGFLFEIPVEVLSAPDYCYDADEGDKTPPLA